VRQTVISATEHDLKDVNADKRTDTVIDATTKYAPTNNRRINRKPLGRTAVCSPLGTEQSHQRVQG